MPRREPLPLASWTLEHLASGERDEALAGDLLEHYRAGRTDGWYCRQVAAACLLSWSRSLAARGPVLAFALIWCLMAPAWQALVESIESDLPYNQIAHFFGPLMLFVLPAGWTALHAAFLWVGLLVFRAAHEFLRKPLRESGMRRAFWLTALILVPTAFATFVFEQLYQHTLPILAQANVAATSLGQIADLGIRANLIRIPYFVALAGALWGTVPPARFRQTAPLLDNGPDRASAESEASAVVSASGAFTTKRFLAFLVAAGVVNAMIGALVFCRLPDSIPSSLSTLLFRAIAYIAIGATAGALGAYAYWQGPWSPFRDQPPLPFPLFALVCASGWVWIPSMVIFFEAISAATALVAIVGTFLLVAGVRDVTYFTLTPAPSKSFSHPHSEAELFEESLYRAPGDATGFTIAICLFVAGVALANQANLIAAVLLALGAALFSWKRTIPRGQSFESQREYRKAALRLALVLVPSILVTSWSLLGGVDQRNRAMQSDGATGASTRSNSKHSSKLQRISYGTGGYESVILWPYPEKSKTVQPIAIPGPVFALPGDRPINIRFDGYYTYVQPPNKLPGPHAHQAHGTPVDVDIESNNAIPVVMEAHQIFPASIRAAQVGHIDIEIENRDNRPGPISLGLLLTGTDLREKRILYLGQQPIVSTLPGRFIVKTEPVIETLHFEVPAATAFPSLTGLNLLILPDIEHRFVAPKIAIRQFQFYPR